MKKYMLFFSIVFCSYTAVSQQSSPLSSWTKQDYLEKSKKQKTAAWVLLAGGAAMTATGLLIPKGDFSPAWNLLDPSTWRGGRYENEDIRSAFLGLGMGAVLGSVPFFRASGRNKRKAASLSLKQQLIPERSPGNRRKHTALALQVTVRL